MDFGSLRQVPGWRDVDDSANWPVLLVRRKDTPLIAPGLDAPWFAGSQRQLSDSGEHGSFRLVSRRRLRLAHALFVIVFGAALALLVWVARTHFTSDADGSGVNVLA
jgi:hypothetical protein